MNTMLRTGGLAVIAVLSNRSEAQIEKPPTCHGSELLANS